ncbi:MAG: ATP-binding protein [Solobacterium sp.]|nr:putative DNA binding domain-containing protein [Solobacterium sp.]MDD5982544.1 ATP-binding protein [Solobacterium sp.]MDD6886576.1 ATP-binding protein [Solobacterium sp.]MDY2731625.1 ATP-binding protein [Erysipelotrichaceae bacterium]
MLEEELEKLAIRVTIQKAESQTIELKSAHQGCPTRLYDSLSSFSNQNEGGVILFGIDEKDDFSIKGVYDAQDLQKKVAEQCKQMEPPVRALFTVCDIDGKKIVSAEIPGVDVDLRPVFYKGVGRIKGSYIRVGESDEPMSEYEIYSYEAFRKRIRDELRTVDDEKFSLINNERISHYLNEVKKEKDNLAKSVSDDDILELMGITKGGKPTLAGLMCFSIYPQAYYPQLCITAVALPGTEQGISGINDERFIDNKRITGSIPEMLDSAVDFVRRNSRNITIIDSNGRRIDKPEYPVKAVREAILNALVHRDYSSYTENIPVRIEMYRDRLEIINSGGLYGNISINELGQVRPDTRNPALANILEVLHYTENRYSGIPTIMNEFASNNFPMPVFSVKHGDFKVVMRNIFYSDNISIEEAVIDFCSKPRSRDEIVSFVGKSKNYVSSKIIIPLTKKGALKLTIPEKPKSSAQKYYKA